MVVNNPTDQKLETGAMTSTEQQPQPSDAVKKPQRKKKKRNHGRRSKAIPLVRGATAASLVKKRESEAAATATSSPSSSSSRSGRRRKRSRQHNPNGGDANGGTEQQPPQKQPQKQRLFASTAESLAVISRFHTLNKRLEQNARDETISESDRLRRAEAIRKEQEEMGGIDRYQKASIYGARSSRFVCADWVVPLLRRDLLQPPRAAPGEVGAGRRRKLRILDVGAIDNQYYGKGYDDWLDAVPIDLCGGQHRSVLQIDFFDYAHAYCSGTDPYPAAAADTAAAAATPPAAALRPYDAVVLSLVLNFQGDPRKRGDMLALAADPRLLAPEGGMLFVALPSASLDNSRYCDRDRFVAVVTNPRFGLELTETKVSAKLVLMAFRRRRRRATGPPTAEAEADPPPPTPPYSYDPATKTFEYGDHEMKRLPAKPGTKRNNFAVILKSSRNRTTAAAAATTTTKAAPSSSFLSPS